MKTIITTGILMLLLFIFSCADKKKSESINKNEIDSYLNEAMKLHGIPGLALAIIENEEVVYRGYFGKASLEENELVDKHTLFRIFSATKLITSTGVFQLIENGKLSLEDKVSKNLDNLPEKWKEVKIKNLLSHSSGLPDFIKYKSTLSDEELMEKLANDSMDFSLGNQFRYNQINYWLLAQVIEKVTGQPFNEYILNNQFEKSENDVLFSSNSQEIISNRATRYFYNGKTKEYEKDTNNNGKRGYAGNGLNITLNAFIDWNKNLDNNELIAAETKTQMWTPFNFVNGTDKFSHGWGIYPVNSLTSVGFSGGNCAAFRKFTKDKVTIILLSNGYIHPAYDIVINDIAKMVVPQLKAKRLTKEEEVMRLILNNKYEEAKSSFFKLKEENPISNFDNLKWNINGIGNSLIRENKIQEALQIFMLNAEVNSNWWVAKAGLAEVYEIQEDHKNAILNYKKAMLLNENNEWNYNELMIKKIDKLKN